MRAQVATFTDRISQTETLDVVKSDALDNRILECAVAAGSEFVVTGDDHLLRLGTFRSIVLVTVADFLAQFSGARR